MTIVGPKPWVNLLGKMSIFRLLQLLVFIDKKDVLSFWNFFKAIFLAYITKKKEVGIMAIFGPTPWVNPFGKMSIFRLYELLVFYLRKAFFRSGISLKTFSWPILPKKKKKLENWPFLDQNHGLTPLKKGQLFVFLNFLFL